MADIFEIAVRNKLRFPFRGKISVEDLWDLSPADLDSVFKNLNAQLKTENEESLLSVTTKENETLSVMIDIVKHIVSVKLSEEAARLQAKEKKGKMQRILEILAERQDKALEGKSDAELQAMINELE